MFFYDADLHPAIAQCRSSIFSLGQKPAEKYPSHLLENLLKIMTTPILLTRAKKIKIIYLSKLKLNLQATGMVISNSLAINSSMSNSRPSSGTGLREEFAHVSSSPQRTRPTSPSTNQHTSVADKLAAMGISANVDFSEPPPPRTPPTSKPDTPNNIGGEDEAFQPVAPAPGIQWLNLIY